MQQILAAHQIPTRIVDLGIASCLGAGSSTALQVLPEHQQTASLLISPIEEEPESNS
jgi:Na+-translocating ferredoxin:NAD+ oxidoreductase RnfC subunit